jgi:pyridoxal phosphate enzyme (YggS family)
MAETDMAGRIARVMDRLAAACGRSGRNPDAVRLMAVSKTQPPEAVAEAAACGLRLFGENRVQEALAKIPMCPSGLEWHLIGHLQANKVRAAVQNFSMIHAVDSVDLLERLNRICGEEGRRLPVCIEVNVAGEASKFGLRPEDVPEALRRSAEWTRVEVAGLMTIPPFAEDPERVRGFFRALRELRDRCRAETGFELPELSMGMSHDLEIAVEEGATCVRVGTDIFGTRS